jgi:hypothetical protein
MKRFLASVAVVLALAGVSYAGSQYNWGTSFGGAWQTPDDTATTIGQPVQIGGGSAVARAGGDALTLYSRTLAQILVLTPETTGQILYCSNCVNTAVVVSTGSTAPGQWAGVFNSTGTVSLVAPK